jgi:hypothetical protein
MYSLFVENEEYEKILQITDLEYKNQKDEYVLTEKEKILSYQHSRLQQ